METLWLKYKILWFLRKKFAWKDDNLYDGKLLTERSDANRIIASAIISQKPFCLMRFGFAELSFVNHYMDRGIYLKANKRKIRKDKMSLCFQNSSEAQQYVKMVLNDCKDADIMAVWKSLEMEDYIINRFAYNPKLIEAPILEPFGLDNPWTMALENKKVLIISPFVEKIESQYERITKVYQGIQLWPKMNIKALKSVWYTGINENSGFGNWFEAYDYLYEEAMKMDFDIALLSCGPFGFDLAARFKRSGKQAIHIGGALQMLFGIMGCRWEQNVYYQKYVNEYWVRAPESEKPVNAEILDNSCYW